jgi:hypothetical protein
MIGKRVLVTLDQNKTLVKATILDKVNIPTLMRDLGKNIKPTIEDYINSDVYAILLEQGDIILINPILIKKIDLDVN